MLPVARHGARERALELLYEVDVKTSTVADVLTSLPLAPDPYTVELVQGVSARQAEHDEVLRRFVKGGWTLERMPTLDRLILRIGVEELAHQPSVPTAVILDEAVQLAKSFSTDDSGRFVNGMLAAIARAVRDVNSDDLDSPARSTAGARGATALDAGALEAPPQTVLPLGVTIDDEPAPSLDGLR